MNLWFNGHMSEQHPTLFDSEDQESRSKTHDELVEMVARSKAEDASLRARSARYASDRAIEDQDEIQRVGEMGKDITSPADAAKEVGRKGVANAREALAKSLNRSNPPKSPNTP